MRGLLSLLLVSCGGAATASPPPESDARCAPTEVLVTVAEDLPATPYDIEARAGCRALGATSWCCPLEKPAP